MKSLSRDEMKKVMGGNLLQSSCSWTSDDTNPARASQPATIFFYGPGTPFTANQAQANADAACAADDCCSNVDCPGAD